MSQCCNSNKCKDVCGCLNFLSQNNSIVITKEICSGSQCCINLEVDPAFVVFNETKFQANSASLVITPGGVNGHKPNIEIVPSTDTGNIFTLGSDGKPFVTGFSIANTECITFTRSVVNGTVIITPIIDWVCVANEVCPLCPTSTPTCIQPLNLVIS